MKNLLLLFCLLQFGNLGAQRFFKNRITLDYTSAINFPIYVGFEFTSKSIIKGFIDNDFNLNLKTGRKTSLELLVGYKNYEYENVTETFYNNGTTVERNRFEYDLNFKEFTYGIGLNYYFGRNYSPIGNSFGIYFKTSNVLVDDYNKFYSFLQTIESDTYKTNTIINYRISTLGVKMNFVSLLSDKVPIFLKYGAGLAIPISSKIFDASFSKNSFSIYSNNLNDRGLMPFLKQKDLYKIYIGFGYML